VARGRRRGARRGGRRAGLGRRRGSPARSTWARRRARGAELTPARRATPTRTRVPARQRGGRGRGWRNLPDARAEGTRWYERAVARDPGFAAAWARLALVQYSMYEARDDARPAARLARARAAAERAGGARLHAARGALALGLMAGGRWQAVERFVVALRSNPNAAALHAGARLQQLALGRADDAAASYARAAALDPRSPAWPAELANAHDNRRAFDEAVRVRERQLALDPRARRRTSRRRSRC
jgi:tetratricopeptide (TPR) repeat protein